MKWNEPSPFRMRGDNTILPVLWERLAHDGFNLESLGIMSKCAVESGSVVGALAGRPSIAAAAGERCPMKRVNLIARYHPK